MLPQLQLNHVKGSWSQPHCWLSHHSPPPRPLSRGYALLPTGCHCPSPTCQGNGMGLHTLPDLSQWYKLNTFTGSILRSLGCILTKTNWVAPTCAATSHISGSDAIAGEGWGVRNLCGSCFLKPAGRHPAWHAWWQLFRVQGEPCEAAGRIAYLQQGRKDVCFHHSAQDEAGQDVTWAHVPAPREKDVLVHLAPPLANINQETKVKCNHYTSTVLCL